MEPYLGWKYLHILMFVFWVGTDMGVFLSCKKATDPKVPIDARFMLLHMALRIELLPRTMWKLALPLGMTLSREMQLIELSLVNLLIIWAFSVAWWVLSVSAGWFYDKPIGHTLNKYNNIVTGIVGSVLIVIAATSLMGNGPFAADATWLSWKVVRLRPDQSGDCGDAVCLRPDGYRIRQAGRGRLDPGNRSEYHVHHESRRGHDLVYLLPDIRRRLYRDHQDHLNHGVRPLWVTSRYPQGSDPVVYSAGSTLMRFSSDMVLTAEPGWKVPSPAATANASQLAIMKILAPPTALFRD